jgi:hypothetical protein
MSSSQYFTPEASDLYVGYECEKVVLDFSCFGDGCPKEWEPHTIGSDLNLGDLREGKHSINVDPRWYRTSYLTKEQIEKEGWERGIHQSFSREGFKKVKENGHTFYCWLTDKNLYISQYIPSKSDDPWSMSMKSALYDGTCPSINEFRKICKLLGI